jgi:hypothetical protein
MFLYLPPHSLNSLFSAIFFSILEKVLAHSPSFLASGLEKNRVGCNTGKSFSVSTSSSDVTQVQVVPLHSGNLVQKPEGNGQSGELQGMSKF